LRANAHAINDFNGCANAHADGPSAEIIPLRRGKFPHGQFIVLPKAAVHDSRMSGVPLRVLAELADYVTAPDQWCFPSAQRIADGLGLSKRAVQYALHRAQACGHLEIERSRGRRPNRYRLVFAEELNRAQPCTVEDPPTVQAAAPNRAKDRPPTVHGRAPESDSRTRLKNETHHHHSQPRAREPAPPSGGGGDGWHEGRFDDADRLAREPSRGADASARQGHERDDETVELIVTESDETDDCPSPGERFSCRRGDAAKYLAAGWCRWPDAFDEWKPSPRVVARVREERPDLDEDDINWRTLEWREYAEEHGRPRDLEASWLGWMRKTPERQRQAKLGAR
jgi:hypothetical protein